MLFKFALHISIFVGFHTCLPASVPNKCPQPSDLIPVPDPFKYGHPNDCSLYFMCNEGQPTLMQCQTSSRFSHVLQTCVDAFSQDDICTRENAQRECSNGIASLIPHSKSCQGYFNCSDIKPRPSPSFFAPFEMECPYPQLFDVEERKCRDFKVAKCGLDRTAAKDACDYKDNMCGGFQCEPCLSRLPSCVGKQDGPNPYPKRHWTPWYIKCDTDRLIESLQCGIHKPTNMTGFFSPERKTCVSIFEVPRETGFGLAPSCKGKEPGLYRTQETAKIYYRCYVAVEVLFCSHGLAFNEISQQCEED